MGPDITFIWRSRFLTGTDRGELENRPFPLLFVFDKNIFGNCLQKETNKIAFTRIMELSFLFITEM